jgi:hypothetical protein
LSLPQELRRKICEENLRYLSENEGVLADMACCLKHYEKRYRKEGSNLLTYVPGFTAANIWTLKHVQVSYHLPTLFGSIAEPQAHDGGPPFKDSGWCGRILYSFKGVVSQGNKVKKSTPPKMQNTSDALHRDGRFQVMFEAKSVDQLFNLFCQFDFYPNTKIQEVNHLKVVILFRGLRELPEVDILLGEVRSWLYKRCVFESMRRDGMQPRWDPIELEFYSRGSWAKFRSFPANDSTSKLRKFDIVLMDHHFLLASDEDRKQHSQDDDDDEDKCGFKVDAYEG